MKRLFIAINIEPNNSFLEKYNILRRASTKLDRINWIEPENLHITLKFIGETEEERIPEIKNRLHQISLSVLSFQLMLDRIGAFGSRYQPRIIWLGCSKVITEMQSLYAKIEKEMHVIGFKPSYGNFVTHLTLARINKIDDKNYFWKSIEQNGNLFDYEVNVKQIILYESILLNKHRPIYKEIGIFNLSER